MKKLLCVITLLATSIVACERPTGILEREVVCLLDLTDPEYTLPSFERIKPLVIPSELNNGVRFTTRLIDDNDFGQRVSAALKPLGTEEQTLEERYAQKSHFIKSAQISYDSMKAKPSGKLHSVIYRVIATELNILSQSKASEKVLIVHSDLFENSDLLQTYSPEDMNMLIGNPQKVIDEYIKAQPIQRLHNTTVYFLYKPKDFPTNQKYRAILSIYQQIITEAGGLVKTSL